MDEIPLAPLPPKKTPTSPASAGPKGPPPAPPRRGFFTKALAVIIGGLVGLVPAAAGLAVFLDPLRRRPGEGAKSVRVTTLDALPDDGVPRQFAIVADRQDAWNRFPNQPIGAVYLRRTSGSREVQAFNAICPHAGCFVAYKPAENEYLCPCHTSAFKVDGQRIFPCPSPRGMDSLPCTVKREGDEDVILVEFANFYSGIAEKKPKA